ncbi:hypothetical protein COE80_19435 [Bacillus pseudomycoides]|uniref:hypothetical protein n=1 Tax=Bacillus pseudomycoides TaxID=64104 RepID=UPI000BFE4810|nr:hypothetical protein [Bacillus pseudomycoides]PHB23087.1 hypothetical protein COE80_19435 [Bacillus pseudomycoides]PHE37616.1 hypothetical protein COF51_16400 [Bacillus pseudomycoides]
MKGQPERYEQMSIYDFLEESQEVPPSETVPQVDEAPSVVLMLPKVSPSSALDTKESSEATDMPLVSEDGHYLTFEFPKFKTNQIVTVSIPEELIFDLGRCPQDVENFYYLQDWKEKQVRVLSSKSHSRRGFTYEVECVRTGKSGHFYEDELK